MFTYVWVVNLCVHYVSVHVCCTFSCIFLCQDQINEYKKQHRLTRYEHPELEKLRVFAGSASQCALGRLKVAEGAKVDMALQTLRL